MKLLPCRSRSCRHEGFAMLPDGKPYHIGNPDRFPFRVYCARCKSVTMVKAAEWNRLPRLSLKRMDELDLTGTIAKDWVGQGFSEDQARDLVGAGLVASSPELARG